jgi:hypothetical protein
MNPEMTVNHNRFTGEERDSEPNLDNVQAPGILAISRACRKLLNENGLGSAQHSSLRTA